MLSAFGVEADDGSIIKIYDLPTSSAGYLRNGCINSPATIRENLR